MRELSKAHAETAKERRKQMAANAEKRAKQILEEEPLPVYVEVLEVGANAKVESLPRLFPWLSGPDNAGTLVC